MCLNVGGKTISHFLSAGKHNIPEEYQDIKEPITQELQSNIFSKYKTQGRKWTNIANQIENETQKKIHPLIIKHITLKIEHKIIDFEKFFEYFSQIPEDISNFINADNFELGTKYRMIEELNVLPRQHIIVNINRNEDINTEIINPDSQESDWLLSENEE